MSTALAAYWDVTYQVPTSRIAENKNSELGVYNSVSISQNVIDITYLIWPTSLLWYRCTKKCQNEYTYSLNLRLWIFGRLELGCVRVGDLSVESFSSLHARSTSELLWATSTEVMGTSSAISKHKEINCFICIIKDWTKTELICHWECNSRTRLHRNRIGTSYQPYFYLFQDY